MTMPRVDHQTRHAGRLLAPNPGPMTLDGTNTWLLRAAPGEPGVVVDPGPLDDGHLAAIVGAGPVAAIVLTHGHLDHSAAAPRLHELTGAPVIARDPAYCLAAEPLDGGRRTALAGLEWLTVLTPGHSADSVCLLLASDRALLTGDTILGRGTTVVAHPDGRLADYLESLQRLRELAGDEVDILLPGHGPVLAEPVAVLEHYLAHRQERLEQVREARRAGAADAAAVVRVVYADVDPVLWPAAELSVRAQLAYLDATDP